MKKRITRYNDRIGPELSSGMMVLTIFLATVVILCVYFACNAEPLRTMPNETGAGTDDMIGLLPETTPPPAVPDELTDVITVPDSDMVRGYLVLVNSAHEYTFGNEDIVQLYHNDEKSGSYGLATSDIACERSVLAHLNEFLDAYVAATEDDKAIINSGYRTYEAQDQILRDRIESAGEEEAYKYVALPGQSEHHTGLGVDIASYGENYDSQWLTQNCARFGFIQRYRADKVAITGISSEYWHYRYVGGPHAEIMMTENLCLEEYIDLIHEYTYASPYEYTTEDGAAYMIYHVAVGGGGETDIPVPRGAEYTISGDNVDGFIIAAKISAGES